MTHELQDSSTLHRSKLQFQTTGLEECYIDSSVQLLWRACKWEYSRKQLAARTAWELLICIFLHHFAAVCWKQITLSLDATWKSIQYSFPVHADHSWADLRILSSVCHSWNGKELKIDLQQVLLIKLCVSNCGSCSSPPLFHTSILWQLPAACTSLSQILDCCLTIRMWSTTPASCLDMDIDTYSRLQLVSTRVKLLILPDYSQLLDTASAVN